MSLPLSIELVGKRVVVIGSGATAATLIPNIVNDCEHVTMLQRSPTWFWTGENRNELADRLRLLEVPEETIHDIVRRDLLQTQQDIQVAATAFIISFSATVFLYSSCFLKEISEISCPHPVNSSRGLES